MKRPDTTNMRPVARARRRSVHSILVPVLAIGAGCVSDQATGRFERHFNARVWGDAAVAITEDPWQWAPTAALAIAWPIANNNDRQWSDSAIEDPLFSDPERTGDYLLYGLIGVSAGYAVYDWYQGDDGVAAEVLIETAVISSLLVKSIKNLTGRQRPAGILESSFPSGHSTSAFVAATFIARRVADETDTAWGYLGYVPAGLVALSRVESRSHFPTDVVVGALIGTVFTNIFYNAHYGSEQRPGIVGHAPRPVAQIDEDFIGLGIEYRF